VIIKQVQSDLVITVKKLNKKKLSLLGCFNPNSGKIWTNPNVWLKLQLKNVQLKVKVEVGFKFEITFLTNIWVCPHCKKYIFTICNHNIFFFCQINLKKNYVVQIT